MSEISQNTGRV
uniref:Uncharacterized protein n=1 Tax=Arundo donax TaxID=35708 RepID=A0A0A8Z8H6_ARUDO